MKIKDQSGQVIIVLLLLMLVVLSMGLAITQRSVTDVTTSSQTEQASRAFSAAEAGVEKSIQTGSPLPLVDLGNNSTAQVQTSGLVPETTGAKSSYAVEYPPIGRETTAQFWLADPNGNAANDYNKNTFLLYFGNPSGSGTIDYPALEVNIILKSRNGSGVDQYYTKKFFYDSSVTRAASNNFIGITCNNATVTTVLALNSSFYCTQTLGPIPDPNNTSLNCGDTVANPTCHLIMVRARLLYASDNHKIAVGPSSGGRLPPQAQIYNATGASGQSQKQLLVFKVKDVVPPWFDFAIFSVNNIKK